MPAVWELLIDETPKWSSGAGFMAKALLEPVFVPLVAIMMVDVVAFVIATCVVATPEANAAVVVGATVPVESERVAGAV